MIKRTLCFSNPAYLSVKNKQLVIKLPEVENNDTLPESFKQSAVTTIPIEDIGIVVLDNQRITITQSVLEQLIDNNCAVITCNQSHLPIAMHLPLEGNTTQTERMRYQIEASLPLKKQLWQQTIVAKIQNQAAVLRQCRGVEVRNMLRWATQVKSGDSDNMEARAAVYYWQNAFPTIPDFVRSREAAPPNNLLNYGYAILRAIVARGLVSSGLLPTLGIHHRNKYNAYCLADDIMEPYRPYVDKYIFDIFDNKPDCSELNNELKSLLLQIPVLDVTINLQRSPLMVAVSTTTASLQKCYSGEARKIIYPTM